MHQQVYPRTVSEDAEKFLKRNKNHWFSANDISKGIGRVGARIATQLDNLALRKRKICLDVVIVKGRQKRIFYGWFDTVEIAAKTFPPVESWEKRSI